MNADIAKLQQQIDELQQKLSDTTEWADGLQYMLMRVLPHLLRGHPEVEKVRDLLQSDSDRYQASSGDLSQTKYEPAKMLYLTLAQLGVWPGVDPEKIAQSAIERHQG